MNANAVARHYDRLTPEERFRLIVAAGGRGDEAEATRQVNSAGTATFSTADHAPFARAFDELATLVFIELLEEAARYHDALAHADDTLEFFVDDEAEAEESDQAEAGRDAETDAEPGENEPRERPLWQRSRDLALAAGYMLRTKAEGWKRFCEQLGIPAFALWRLYPGFDRLQRTLALAEKVAFAPEGFLGWLNDRRPAGEPERTAAPLTVEGMAAEAEAMFGERVQWWGG
jgi:hypothetical protein